MEDNIFDKVQEVDLQKKMEESYIEYAMSGYCLQGASGCKRRLKAGAEKNPLFYDRVK